MFYIENDNLKVCIDPKGAELKSIISKIHDIEYLWAADPAYWAKTSPVLFPVVGQLMENTYQYKGQSYALPRHGFARDQVFKVVTQEPDAISFFIDADENTLALYPFHFAFTINYTLSKDRLTVEYNVQNKGSDSMPFSVGGHPAFKVPLVEGTSYEDYQLVFETEETTGRWPVNKDGLIDKVPMPLLEGTKVLPLRKELFKTDALVLKGLQSRFVELVSDKTKHGLHFSFSGFPYLGLWASPGADFLCIEPWCGIADSVDTNQDIELKEGIVQLPSGETFIVQWNVQFF